MPDSVFGAADFVSRAIVVAATIAFLGWSFLNLSWPVEDYGDVTHAYAESTNQIVRGMGIGIAGYLAVLGVAFAMRSPRRGNA